MNKNTIIWIVCAIIVVIIGFVTYKAFNKAPAPASAQQSAAANTAANASSTQVQAQEVAVGTGAQAAPGTKVSVLYVGQLQDGTVFDSSAMHNNQPYTFVLGSTDSGSPIPGFQIGVNGMKVGGERLMAIPPSLGYGTQEIKDGNGKVVIPANSTIIFDVKLVAVGDTTTAPANPKAPAKKK